MTDDSVKVIMAGDYGVGKSCLLLRWAKGEYVPDASATIDTGKTKAQNILAKRPFV